MAASRRNRHAAAAPPERSSKFAGPALTGSVALGAQAAGAARRGGGVLAIVRGPFGRRLADHPAEPRFAARVALACLVLRLRLRRLCRSGRIGGEGGGGERKSGEQGNELAHDNPSRRERRPA